MHQALLSGGHGLPTEKGQMAKWLNKLNFCPAPLTRHKPPPISHNPLPHAILLAIQSECRKVQVSTLPIHCLCEKAHDAFWVRCGRPHCAASHLHSGNLMPIRRSPARLHASGNLCTNFSTNYCQSKKERESENR